MHTKRLKGIIPAIVTPFQPAGESIDEPGVRRLIDFLIGKGIHGLFALGTTGESIYLDLERKKTMASLAVEHTGGKVPVIVHVGAPVYRDVLEMVSHAAKIGADGIALVPPIYYSIDDLGMERFFSEIADKTDLPLYIYNIPMNAKNSISVSLFKKLADAHPQIAGMKDSSMNFDQYYELVQVKAPHHAALMGNDGQILPAMAIGGQGAVSAGATAIPEPYVQLYEACVREDWESAKKWQYVCLLVKRLLVKSYPIATHKQVLAWRGICGNDVTSPLRQMTAEETEQLRREYEQLKTLINIQDV